MADLTRIDDDTMNAFMAEKWGNPVCEVCQSQQWSLSRSMNARWAGIPVVTDQSSLASSFWAVLPVLCNNCGNTKLLTVGVAESWAATPSGQKAIAEYRGRKNG